MKNIALFAAFFAVLFLAANNASAQNSAYWNKQAEIAVAKADRVINHYNKQYKVFSPQEMRMMRTDPKKFTQLANKKTRRYEAAGRQYDAYYNRQWAESFNTFNTPLYRYDRHGNRVRVR